jgi:hypothetical protein
MNSLMTIVLTFWMHVAVSECNCDELKDGKENYLFKICSYIKTRNIDVSPGDPCKYKIEYITKDILEKRKVIIIYLNCCHLGDRAYIDRETLEVISFRLGAI